MTRIPPLALFSEKSWRMPASTATTTTTSTELKAMKLVWICLFFFPSGVLCVYTSPSEHVLPKGEKWGTDVYVFDWIDEQR